MRRRGDRLAGSSTFVRREIVEHHDVAGSSADARNCSTWAPNAGPVIGPSGTTGATTPRCRGPSMKGGCAPVAVGHSRDQVFERGTSTLTPSHFGSRNASLAGSSDPASAGAWPRRRAGPAPPPSWAFHASGRAGAASSGSSTTRPRRRNSAPGRPGGRRDETAGGENDHRSGPARRCRCRAPAASA
jgi:hypothetical protein